MGLSEVRKGLDTLYPMRPNIPYFSQNVILERCLRNDLKETLNKIRNTRFPKQEITFEKLLERAQSVKYKNVFTTILLTNLIYHLHEFLPLQLLHLRQWMIMQAT